MKLKYYLRGMGIGMILTAIIMGIALHGRQETLSDAEIMARARELGMIDSTVLSDYAAQGTLGMTGENGNNADGSAGETVKTVTQSGDVPRRVVFESLDDKKEPAGTGSSATGASKEAAKTTPSNGATAGSSKEESAIVVADNSAATGSSSAADAASSAQATAVASKAASVNATAAASKETPATTPSDNGSTAKATAAASEQKPAEEKPAEEKPAVIIADAAPEAPAEPAAPTPAPEPAPEPEPEPAPVVNGKSISVASGMDSRAIASLLVEAGAVESASEFDQYLCNRHVDRVLRTGTKTIPEGADWDTIVSILTR